VSVSDSTNCAEKMLDGGWATSFSLWFRVGDRTARVAGAVWARGMVAHVQWYTDRRMLMDCRDTLLSRVTSVREISCDPVIHICSRNGGGETGPDAFKETG
jgi:hypothetical protein